MGIETIALSRLSSPGISFMDSPASVLSRHSSSQFRENVKVFGYRAFGEHKSLEIRERAGNPRGISRS